MTRPCQRQINPVRNAELSKLSFDVLCVRVQALNLPGFGSRIRLLQTLKFASTADATHPASPQSRTSFGRVTKSSARLRKKARRHVRNEFSAQSSFTLDQSGLKPEQDCPFGTGLPVDGLFGSPVEFRFSETNYAMLTPDQLCAIQATASFSSKVALANLQCPDGHSAGVANPRAQNHQAQSSVPTPLDVNHQLGRSLEEKIFRGKYIDPFGRV